MSTRAFVPRDEVTTSGPPEGPTRLPDHNGRLAVFDLDRTLLPGSSLSLFAHRLLAALLADVADREAGPLLDVAEGLGDELARTARPGARWLLDRHLAAGDFCVIASASPQALVEAAVNPDRRLRREARTHGWPVLTF